MLFPDPRHHKLSEGHPPAVSGPGARCAEAQADGVPCEGLDRDCEICEHALDDDEEAEERMDDALARVRVPTNAIGLQAHAILFAGVKAKAREPWWGDGTG